MEIGERLAGEQRAKWMRAIVVIMQLFGQIAFGRAILRWASHVMETVCAVIVPLVIHCTISRYNMSSGCKFTALTQLANRWKFSET